MTNLSDSQLNQRLRPLLQTQEGPAPYIAGRYEVVQTLSGGMALVHLCRDHEASQLVALKTFKPEYMPHRNARDLFLREGTMWVDIGQHPHIVRAHRVERTGDGLEVFVVLEWVMQPQGVDKPSLRAWLRPGHPLPVERALTFALHVARGMKFAVQRIPGLVHRDIKPENVLIGYDGLAKVTDFGLASTLSSLTDIGTGSLSGKMENMDRTQLTQGIAGTPLYMAPEQWARLPLDSRADIYALGCILYEMVTGRLAAYADSREAVRQIHVSGQIKPPPATVPKDVTLFLRKCMMTQRNQRFRNWAEVEEALESVYWRVTGTLAPPERAVVADTREERLAAGHSYNNMGLSYLDIGKLSVALMYFEQAVWIARAEASLELEGAALGSVGLAHQALGYTERAIEFHEEDLSISRQLGDRSEESRALGNIGRAYRQLGRAPEAIRYHTRQLHIAQEVGDRFKEAAALDSLGDTYWQLEDVSKAVEYYKRSLSLARQIEDRARVKSILSSMGRVYLHSGDIKEAVALFHQALSLARRIADRVGEGEALGDLGYLYDTLGYTDRAIEFYERALEIARESKDRRREARNLMSIGDLYFATDAAAQAKVLYEQALAAVEEIGDQIRQMDLLSKLGATYGALGDHMQAARLHKRVLLLAQEVGNLAVAEQVLQDLGEAYERWGDVGRAIEYFNEQLDLIQRNEGDWPAKRQVLARIGPLYVRLKQYRASLDASQRYLELSRAAGDKEAVGEALGQLGSVYRLIADPKKASEALREVVDVARELKDEVMETAALGSLGLAYYEMGRKWQSTRQLEKALSKAQELGDAPLLAQTTYRLALVYAKQKKWSRALPLAREADGLYRQLQDEGMLKRTARMLDSIAEQKDKTTGFLS